MPVLKSDAPEKLFWVHIPKTGTSFINTLIHYGCAFDTQKHIMPNWQTRQRRATALAKHESDFRSALFSKAAQSTPGVEILDESEFWKQYPPEKFCPRLYGNCSGGNGCAYGMLSHEQYANQHRGKLLTFVREPTSLYTSIITHLYSEKGIITRPEDLTPALVKHFCAHKFSSVLTSGVLGLSKKDKKRKMGKSDADLACATLKTDFFFIGDTRKWAESILLFHCMSYAKPEPPAPSQMQNTRPNAFIRSNRVGTSQLIHRTVHRYCQSASENRVFRCATKLFEAKLQEHTECISRLRNASLTSVSSGHLS